MAILAKYTKQPGEVQDYDVDFTPYLSYHADTAASFVATIEAGATITNSSMSNGVVKVWVSGGVDGGQYKVTVRLTTASVPARIKEAEILVKVKES